METSPNPPAAPGPDPQDMRNLIAVARLSLSQLKGADLINVATSIANVEALMPAASFGSAG